LRTSTPSQGVPYLGRIIGLIRVLAYCCALLLLGVHAARADASGERDLGRAAPVDVGMSSAALAELGALMRGLVDEGELSGSITAVTRRGKLVHWQAYGYRDTDRRTPLTDDTIFRIYSMSKPVTGVALMTLYEEGRFELDDPVENYIPELKGLEVAAADGADGWPLTEEAEHPMTIRELVSHTSGLTYGIFSRSQVDSLYLKAKLTGRDQSLKEFIDKLAGLPLKSQPGSRWHYSVGPDVQGYLVEVLAGKPFEEVLAERIFQPLGMKDTAFWVPPEKADRLATLYHQNRSGGRAPVTSSEYLAPPRFPSGGGGLVGTTMDYLRFCQMLANGGELNGVRILRPETVALMHTNQLPPSVSEIDPRIGNPGNEFGVDFAIVARPDGTTDHILARSEFWWYGIGGTWFGINPVQDVVVVGMIQQLGGGASRRARLESKKLVYGALLPQEGRAHSEGAVR